MKNSLSKKAFRYKCWHIFNHLNPTFKYEWFTSVSSTFLHKIYTSISSTFLCLYIYIYITYTTHFISILWAKRKATMENFSRAISQIKAQYPRCLNTSMSISKEPCSYCFLNPDCFAEISSLHMLQLVEFSFIRLLKNIYHMCLDQNDQCNQFIMLNMDTTDIINIKAMANLVHEATMHQYGGYISDLCATSLQMRYVYLSYIFFTN